MLFKISPVVTRGVPKSKGGCVIRLLHTIHAKVNAKQHATHRFESESEWIVIRDTGSES